LSEYLLDTFGEEAKSRGVVVGYDHRAYGDLSSKSFFDITVKVFSQKGIKVYAFHQFAFTPLVVGLYSFLRLVAFCDIRIPLLCWNYDYSIP
jgi:singapore isolate B (sub-type 7) whole genome shotgun sequence assembly, scaffold_0